MSPPLDVAEVTQHAMWFRTYENHDPCQRYLDRVVPDPDGPLPKNDLLPTVDEARAMLAALHAMTHRLHPSTYGIYIAFQAMLLDVISDARPLRPEQRIAVAQAALAAATAQLRSDVHDARNSGISWAVIGRELGVSRQAAFERFS